MFIQFTVPQVVENWDFLRVAISKSMPKSEQRNLDVSNNILMALMAGEMQCWASHKLVDGKASIRAIVVTKLCNDSITHNRTLLIHNVYGIAPLTDSDWNEGFLVLKKWAMDEKCYAMTGYTDVPSLVEKVKNLKADVSAFFTIPLSPNFGQREL